MFYNNSTFKIIAFLALFFLTSYDVESRIVDTIEALQEKKIGDKQASIKIVEFASLTCGHCAKFHNEVFPKIKKEYIDTKKHYIIESVHPSPLSCNYKHKGTDKSFFGHNQFNKINNYKTYYCKNKST